MPRTVGGGLAGRQAATLRGGRWDLVCRFAVSRSDAALRSAQGNPSADQEHRWPEFQPGGTRTAMVQGLGVLCLLAIYAWLACRVSYRWFDCLYALIPIYGLVWIARIVWRVAYLPHRDWIPPPEELTSRLSEAACAS